MPWSEMMSGSYYIACFLRDDFQAFLPLGTKLYLTSRTKTSPQCHLLMHGRLSTRDS